jgi:polysaccharide biosynthesis protein PslH
VQILYVTTDFVWPAERGGRVRSLSQLRVLSSLPEVEAIRLFSLSEDPIPPQARAVLAREVAKLEVLEPVFHPIHLFRHPRYVPRVAWLRIAQGVPYVAGKWESASVRRALERELLGRPFDVVWLDGLGNARYLSLVRQVQPQARVVLDEHNVENERFAQFARHQTGLRRLVAEAEWRAARRFEREALLSVDGAGAISRVDADAYRDLAGIEAVTVPQVVPFVRRAPTTALGPRLCYVGSLSWEPNVRGLDWFCVKVWPRVRQRLPDATFEIAGNGLRVDATGIPRVPPAWQTPGVTILGFVPDLGPLYERSAAMVAPILGGSGIRIKLLEAFRFGMPVVTTPDGASGLPIVPGREAIVESDPERFAERVVRVASSQDEQARLREAGYAFLERHNGLPAAQAAMRDLLRSRGDALDTEPASRIETSLTAS